MGRFTWHDFVACDNGLRQAHDMIYDCCVRQKKCRSILKHVLKRCDNRKSCRRPVVSLSHATKSYRVNRPYKRQFCLRAVPTNQSKVFLPRFMIIRQIKILTSVVIEIKKESWGDHAFFKNNS